MSLLPIRIFEYDQNTGSLVVTENAAMVPELRRIMEKYPDPEEQLPYLVFVHLMTALDGPFANVDDDEKEDAVIFDIHQLYPDRFDPEEPLLRPAVERLANVFDSSIILMAKEMEQEFHRMRKTLRENPIVLGGDDSNFKDRLALMEKLEKIANSFAKVKKQAEEEIKTKMKGKAELGDY